MSLARLFPPRTVPDMFELPPALSELAAVPAPLALISEPVLLSGELPSPLLPAVETFSTVQGESGVVWTLHTAFDAACRDIPLLMPQEWLILGALAHRDLLFGGERERINAGLRVRKLGLVEKGLLERLTKLSREDMFDVNLLAVVSEVCLPKKHLW